MRGGGHRPSGAGHGHHVMAGANRGTVLTVGCSGGGEGFLAEGAEPVVAAAGEFAGHRDDGATAAEPVGDLLRKPVSRLRHEPQSLKICPSPYEANHIRSAVRVSVA